MADVKGHGNGAGARRLEVLPIKDLPAGVPGLREKYDSPKAARLRADITAAEAELATATGRNAEGHVDPVIASLMGRIGGFKRALSQELSRLAAEQHLQLSELALELLPGMTATDPDFAAGLPKVLEFMQSESASLREDVGGGELPDGPMSMLVSAGLQTLASRIEFARGNFKLASALANDSRQNLMACHEYCAKRALARSAGEVARNGGRPPIPKRFLIDGGDA